MSTIDICLSIFSTLLGILFGSLLKQQSNAIREVKEEFNTMRDRVTKLEVNEGEFKADLKYIRMILDEIKESLKR